MASKTVVVNVARGDAYDIYIGDEAPEHGLKRSQFANPFRIGTDGTAIDVVEKFRSWVLTRPDLIVLARRELRGKRLGCWCAPGPCHGDILAEIADDQQP